MQTTTLTGVQATVNCGNTLLAIGGYVVPAATSAIISHICLCNKNPSVAVTVQLSLYNGATDAMLAFNTVIQPTDSLVFGGVDFKIVLGTGWTVRASCNTAASVDATMSVTQAV